MAPATSWCATPRAICGPSAPTAARLADRLSGIGSPPTPAARERPACPGPLSEHRPVMRRFSCMSAMGCEDWNGHVIVCGLHGLGLRIVEQLRQAGHRVVVIDDEADIRLARVVIGWGVPHLTGNAALPETLAEAGLGGAAAVICVERTDLHNLEISLQAHHLRPDVRVITHIRNRAVGRALGADDAPGSVLDVAALSAPSVIEACLSDTVHRLDLDDNAFLVVDTKAERDGTVRELFGELIPLAVQPAAGGEPEICPDRDHKLRTGDEVTLIGTEAGLLESGVVPRPRHPRPHHPRPHHGLAGGRRSAPASHLGNALARHGSTAAASAATAKEAAAAAPSPVLPPPPARLVRLWRAGLVHGGRVLWSGVGSRGLRWALTTLGALVVVSTIVLWRGYREPGMSVLDGLYFSIETIATVGFGDFSFAGQPVWLRVYAIMLMITGVSTSAVVLAYLTDLLISRRLEHSYGQRVAAGMSGHVVVIGLGNVGVEVMNDLKARGQDVVVIESDTDNRFLGQARALKVPVVFGDATLPATLAAANLRRSRAVAVLTSDDMVNIEAGLTVRDVLGDRWDTTPVVLRIFERSLARTLAGRFGFHHVRSTAELAAPWFVGAALGLEVLGTFTAQDRSFLAGRFKVADKGGLDGMAMHEFPERAKV